MAYPPDGYHSYKARQGPIGFEETNSLTNYAGRCPDKSKLKSASSRYSEYKSSSRDSSTNLIDVELVPDLQELVRILGTKITGVTLYTGGLGTTFGRGLIASELNRKITSKLASNRGHLFWVSLDPLNRRRFQNIQVINPGLRPTYYVTIGSNQNFNRLYVGVYYSQLAGQLKLGAVLEIVPTVESI
jgi:hypothetical protein